MGITAGSREVPGRNACEKRHPYRIIIIMAVVAVAVLVVKVVDGGTNWEQDD